PRASAWSRSTRCGTRTRTSCWPQPTARCTASRAYGATGSVLQGWDPAPLVLAGAAIAICLFVHGFLRLRRRGRTDCAGRGRALLFAAGLTAVVVPLVSPLDGLADTRSLPAHMLQHLLIGDVAPALLLLAVRGPLLAFVIPVAAARFLGRHARL